MIRGYRHGVCLIIVCWASAAFGAATAETAQQKKPLTVEQMHKMNSTQLLMRTDATAEEDYQAGIIAYDRAEIIEAQDLFARAGKKGHTGAMVRYAELVLRAGFSGEAVDWYRKAAELGDPDGQFNLAAMYLDLGNYNLKNLDSKMNVDEARKWMLKAAEQGHKDAITLVYLAYSHGGMGLTDADRTDAEVLKWTQKAIEQGNGAAMDEMSNAYRNGKYGLPVDIKLADEWAAKAKIAYGIKEEEKKETIPKKRKKRL